MAAPSTSTIFASRDSDDLLPPCPPTATTLRPHRLSSHQLLSSRPGAFLFRGHTPHDPAILALSDGLSLRSVLDSADTSAAPVSQRSASHAESRDSSERTYVGRGCNIGACSSLSISTSLLTFLTPSPAASRSLQRDVGPAFRWTIKRDSGTARLIYS